MKVLIDPRAGFCGGVKRVVRMAEQHMSETGEPLVSLGDVIHNEVEIGRLGNLGLSSADHDLLDGKITKNRKVLIRAHGEPPETFERAAREGVELIDGTCPVVTRSQNIARAHYLNGEQVAICGKPYHPETIGILGHCDHQAFVVYDRADVDKLDPHKKTFVLAQTTVSSSWFDERIQWIRERCAGAEVKVENTLCRFVVGRDRDLVKFAKDVDVVIMVGGTKSSNTRVLYQVCRNVNSRSFLVVTEKDIDLNWFKPNDTVGITGSASTPHWLLQRVKAFVEERAKAAHTA